MGSTAVGYNGAWTEVSAGAVKGRLPKLSGEVPFPRDSRAFELLCSIDQGQHSFSYRAE